MWLILARSAQQVISVRPVVPISALPDARFIPSMICPSDKAMPQDPIASQLRGSHLWPTNSARCTDMFFRVMVLDCLCRIRPGNHAGLKISGFAVGPYENALAGLLIHYDRA